MNAVTITEQQNIQSATRSAINAANRRRGQSFEAVVLRLLGNPLFGFSNVWRFKDSPIRWHGRDTGTDIIARRRADGRYVAVQVKDSVRVTKAEIDSFLSDTNRPEVHERLLVSRSDAISHNALATLQGQQKPARVLCGVELANLLRKMQDEVIAPRAMPSPRKHQREAISDVVRGLAAEERGQLIMACGTGKTLTQYWVAEKLNARTVLVALPSLSLVRQTLAEWLRVEDFKWLAVCSDATVVPTDEHPAEDSFISVTTDAKDVRKFMAGNCTERRVIFCTYHSQQVIVDAKVKFDLAIADEAHKLAGRPDSAFALFLDAKKIKATKRLFATATPRIVTVRTENGRERESVCSMDDMEKFGREFHSLPFGRARDLGLLADYRIRIIGVDDKQIAAEIQRGALLESDAGVTDARSLAAVVALKKIIEQGSARILTFHARVDHARESARLNRELIGCYSQHVDGTMPVSERSRIMAPLTDTDRSKPAIISNAQCLSEGVDVPSIDCVLFAAPRSGVVNIIQPAGRPMRLDKNNPNKVAEIVVPVIIGEGESVEEKIEASDFSTVIEVVEAMAAADVTLRDELQFSRREIGRTGIRSVSVNAVRRIVIDLPAGIPAGFEEAIRLVTVERTGSAWDKWFGILQAFVAANGRFPLGGERHNGAGVGYWARDQRVDKRYGQLSAERVEALEAIAGWRWGSGVVRAARNTHSGALRLWDEQLATLQEFIAKNGRLPMRPERHGEVKIGMWCNTQRTNKKRGTLSTERIAALEGVSGWWWGSGVVRAEQRSFDDQLQALQEFIAKNGRLPMATEQQGGVKIGVWCSNQRQQKKRGTLPAERVTKLDAIPEWRWSSRG